MGSLKKYNFNAKIISRIQECIAGAIIVLHVFVFIEKNNSRINKMSENLKWLKRTIWTKASCIHTQTQTWGRSDIFLLHLFELSSQKTVILLGACCHGVKLQGDLIVFLGWVEMSPAMIKHSWNSRRWIWLEELLTNLQNSQTRAQRTIVEPLQKSLFKKYCLYCKLYLL